MAGRADKIKSSKRGSSRNRRWVIPAPAAAKAMRFRLDLWRLRSLRAHTMARRSHPMSHLIAKAIAIKGSQDALAIAQVRAVEVGSSSGSDLCT